jgi:hypothetical protein
MRAMRKDCDTCDATSVKDETRFGAAPRRRRFSRNSSRINRDRREH